MRTVVLDASAVVRWLVDPGPVGEWVAGQLQADLHAPALLPAEFASGLRRVEIGRGLDPQSAAVALEQGLALPVQLHPFVPFAARVWQLRRSITTYDAWYVALAETLDAPLVTLDARLARAPGLRCEVLVP